MPGPLIRFPFVRRMSAVLVFAAALAAILAIVFGVSSLQQGQREVGVEFLLLGLGVLILGGLVYCQMIVMLKFESNTYRLYDSILDTIELQRQHVDLLRTVADNSSLSEWAKKIVYREKDHEFLRDSIQGSIVREDWEAAAHLIRELDELGYAEEARQLSQQIEKSRQAGMEERIDAAVKRFDQLCAAQKWEQARRETARLMKTFPDSPRIAGLPAEIELRRQEHKRALLKQYDEAARRNEVERATQLLVELDSYLAPNEGAALKESARGVFRAKLMQMGVQFSLAVSDRQFLNAIEIGEQIMREYPNSRYAHEIADMMPHLRRRSVGTT